MNKTYQTKITFMPRVLLFLLLCLGLTSAVVAQDVVLLDIQGAIGQATDEVGKMNAGSELTLFDPTTFMNLIIRFGINLLVTTILIRFIYYPVAKRKDFLFTYMLISTAIFLLCYLLANVHLDLAFALGLFAIFGIIRYRTDAIPIKEMTYLFVIIGLAVMNALVAGISIAEIALANVVLIGLAYGLEKVWLLRHESRKIILYERIDLVKAGNRVALKKDLEERTGIKINRVEVGRIDFLRDTALIKIFFFEDLQEGHYEESFDKEN